MRRDSAGYVRLFILGLIIAQMLVAAVTHNIATVVREIRAEQLRRTSNISAVESIERRVSKIEEVILLILPKPEKGE